MAAGGPRELWGSSSSGSIVIGIGSCIGSGWLRRVGRDAPWPNGDRPLGGARAAAPDSREGEPTAFAGREGCGIDGRAGHRTRPRARARDPRNHQHRSDLRTWGTRRIRADWRGLRSGEWRPAAWVAELRPLGRPSRWPGPRVEADPGQTPGRPSRERALMSRPTSRVTSSDCLVSGKNRRAVDKTRQYV